MDINNINIRKFGFKKTEEKKSEYKPTIQNNQPELTEKEKTVLAKIRDKALSSYVAAMMALGGTTAMTSCVEQNVEVTNNDEETKKMLEQMLKLQQQILEQLIQNNTDNKEMIEQNKKIIEILQKVYSGVTDIQGAINEIYVVISESNEHDKEFLDKIDQIIANQQDGNKTLDEILKANQEQNAFLANIESLIKGLEAGNSNLSQIIEDFYNEYKQGNLAHSELLNSILNSIKEGNGISENILNAIQNLESKLENGQISESQMLEEIIKLLGNINDKLGTIIGKLDEIGNSFNQFVEKYDQNSQQIIEQLGNIEANQATISNQLDKIMQKQDQSNDYLANISQKGDEITSILEEIKVEQGNNLTYDQLVELLEKYGKDYTEVLDQILGKLESIDNKQPTIDQIIEAIAQNKTDLTKTNALIETLITVVQNLASTSSTEQLEQIKELLQSMKDSNDQSNEEMIASLTDIINKLANMQGSLDAMTGALTSIKENQEKFMSEATMFGTKLFDELAKIKDNMVDPAKLEAYAESYKEALVKAEQTRQEQKVLLQAILEKEGSNGSITIEDLKEIIPDYTDLLNEIKEAIGNVVTSDDLNNFFVNTKPDLTKTNALIETLITVVQNSNIGSGGSTGDLSQLESMLGQIRDAIESGNTASEAQIKELIELVRKLGETGENPGTRSVNLPEGWKLY